jgi:hypothetical protein
MPENKMTIKILENWSIEALLHLNPYKNVKQAIEIYT